MFIYNISSRTFFIRAVGSFIEFINDGDDVSDLSFVLVYAIPLLVFYFILFLYYYFLYNIGILFEGAGFLLQATFKPYLSFSYCNPLVI